MLTVLNVAYPFAPVGPDAVGGAEQVLSHIDQALTLAGHHSIVAACGGSRVSGTLMATDVPSGTVTPEIRREVHHRHFQTICRALERWPVDVIHMHGIDFMDYLPPEGPLTLVTLHLPLDWYSFALRSLRRSRTWLHCVSRTQRAGGCYGLPLLPEIENGVSEAFFAARHAPRNFALTLGRMCPEKGFHLAIDACNRAGVPCLLAGQVFPHSTHESYFNAEIVSRLDERVRFIGPLGFQRKRRFLAAARCLLVPSLVAETSSLVAMEALACGTPVIAFASGALPDIVEHGKTGFIVRDVSEMAAAIREVDTIDRAVCREVARKRFSLQHTLDRYIELYQQLKTSARMAEPQMFVPNQHALVASKADQALVSA
jgi:glycosyltransferase involved in cell wall biosynthesis